VLRPSTLQHTIDCDIDAPTLRPLTTFGEENKVDSLRTSEGWRELKKIQVAAGVVGHGYPQKGADQNFNRRIEQYATLHLWDGTCAVSTCPTAMTDGAAVLLRRHFDDADGDQPGRAAVFRESHDRLVSLDNNYAWTSGQWMTERSGGSDVRGTETVARRLTAQEIQADADAGRDKDAHNLPLGPWLVDGFKWFSSATDADMAILLAQTAKGLSAFYAPLRRRAGHNANLSASSSSRATLTTETPSFPSEMNGVRIQRLKSKLGTKGVPTAELELKSMRAYLVGQEGQGVKEIASILNITRLHTASGSVGYWARGLAVSRAYTQVRKIRDGQLLRDNAQHLAWMAGESVKYRASVHLVFLAVALLGATEQGYGTVSHGGTLGASTLIPQSRAAQENLLRLLTPVMKAQVSLHSVAGLRECMESLGGVGYCENNEDGGVMNIARLFRDCAVNPIWEGTTSVMAEDVARVLKNPRARGANVLDQSLGVWVRDVLRAIEKKEDARGTFARELDMVRNRYAVLERTVRTSDSAALQRRGRDVLDHVEAVTCACLLMFDAVVDGDAVAVEVARRWVRMNALASDKVKVQEEEDRGVVDHPADEIDMDRRIFLGPAAASRATVPATRQAKL
jgi:alkylation response protein AidB-like acyl-CoA dehydrogenase